MARANAGRSNQITIGDLGRFGAAAWLGARPVVSTWAWWRSGVASTECPHIGQNWPRAGNSAPHSAQEASAGPDTGAAVTSGDGTACPHFRQNCEPSGRFAPHLPQSTAVSWGFFD